MRKPRRLDARRHATTRRHLATLAACAIITSLSPPASADAGESGEAEARAVADHPSDTLRPLIRRGGHSRAGFDTLPAVPVEQLSYEEIVRPDRFVPGSLSLGTTSHGELLRSARLPIEGESHFVLDEHRGRGTQFGTEELVGVLLDAADAVARAHPGTRVGFGNLAARDGGDIRWSRSHNNGRDADIAFLFSNEDGEPVELDDLAYVRRDGSVRGHPGIVFDVARNWTLVEALIESDEAQVQWLFVYAPLARSMIEHAESIGADEETIERARVVLHQPGDSSRHNDHLHLRIFCSLEDRLEGCVNWGPMRAWADDYEEHVRARVAELLHGLFDGEEDVVRACLDFIRRLQPREVAAEIAAAIPHQPPDVQLELIDMVAELDQPGCYGPLVPIAESSPHPAVRERAFWALGRLADQTSAPALAGVVARDHGAPLDGETTRYHAAHALRNIYNPVSVSSLIPALDDPSPETRERVERVLHRITGWEAAIDASDPELDHRGRDELVAQWTAWWQKNQSMTQDAWLAAAFMGDGFEVGDLQGDVDLEELLRAVEEASDPLSFMADRLLIRETGSWTPSESWSRSRRVRHWSRVLDD